MRNIILKHKKVMEKTKLIEMREEAFSMKEKLTEQHDALKSGLIYGEETYYKHAYLALDEWIEMLYKLIKEL